MPYAALHRADAWPTLGRMAGVRQAGVDVEALHSDRCAGAAHFPPLAAHVQQAPGLTPQYEISRRAKKVLCSGQLLARAHPSYEMCSRFASMEKGGSLRLPAGTAMPCCSA